MQVPGGRGREVFARWLVAPLDHQKSTALRLVSANGPDDPSSKASRPPPQARPSAFFWRAPPGGSSSPPGARTPHLALTLGERRRKRALLVAEGGVEVVEASGRFRCPSLWLEAGRDKLFIPVAPKGLPKRGDFLERRVSASNPGERPAQTG